LKSRFFRKFSAFSNASGSFVHDIVARLMMSVRDLKYLNEAGFVSAKRDATALRREK
jgi:hypothetical protein